MAATEQNVTIFEGDEPTLRLALRSLDEAGADVGPLDLTGATVSWRMQGRTARNAVIVGSPADGIADVALLGADSTGRGGAVGDSRRWWHEVRVTDAFGVDLIALTGTITVRGALHDEP